MIISSPVFELMCPIRRLVTVSHAERSAAQQTHWICFFQKTRFMLPMAHPMFIRRCTKVIWSWLSTFVTNVVVLSTKRMKNSQGWLLSWPALSMEPMHLRKPNRMQNYILNTVLAGYLILAGQRRESSSEQDKCGFGLHCLLFFRLMSFGHLVFSLFGAV